MRRIYLDNGATTFPKPKSVPEAMSRFSGLTEPEQKQVVNRARNIMSHEEMRNYVENMFTEG